MSDPAWQGSGSSRMDRARALALLVMFCAAATLPASGAVSPPPPPVPPAPAVLAWTAPFYPPGAQEARLTPTVQVRVRIDPEGNVIAAAAERQLPLGISEASVVAAREWRFAPGAERAAVLSFEFRLDRSGSRLKRPAEVLDPLHLRIWGIWSLLPAEPAPPLQPCSLEGVDLALTHPEPKVLSWSAPSYSVVALKARLQGTAIVAAEVDASGAVIWTCARRGLPMNLGRNSERAIEDWRFAPDPRPVRWVEVELNFALADGEDEETERPAELLTPLHLRVWGTPPALPVKSYSAVVSQPGGPSVAIAERDARIARGAARGELPPDTALVLAAPERRHLVAGGGIARGGAHPDSRHRAGRRGRQVRSLEEGREAQCGGGRGEAASALRQLRRGQSERSGQTEDEGEDRAAEWDTHGRKVS
jgi:hypothetical protein